MRNALLASICLISTLGCGILNRNDSAGNADNRTKPTPSPDVKPSPPVTNQGPAPSKVIAVLKRSAGKYPNEIKLFDRAEIKKRLKKLMAKDFAAMEAAWNVETPIEIEDGIFMASGCEAHNCPSNNYLMFVDLKGDNINVFHFDDNGVGRYFERGKIELPKTFTKIFNDRSLVAGGE